MKRWDTRLFLIIATAALAGGIFSTGLNAYYQSLAFSLLLYIGLAVSWNLLAGFTGYLSFGHTAFFAAGAYAAAIAGRGVPPLAVIVAGGIGALVLSVAFVFPLIRLRGMYFAIGSLGISEVCRVLALEFAPITGGATGHPIVSGVEKQMGLLILTILVFLLATLSGILGSSRLGKQMIAIREDEDAAESVGIATLRLKLLALCSSAFATGSLGVMYGWWLTYADVSDLFSISRLVTYVAGTVLGGLGTLTGPVVGSLILGLIAESAWVRFPFLHQLATGLTIILVVVFLPRGVIGAIAQVIVQRASSRSRSKSQSRWTDGSIQRTDALSAAPKGLTDQSRTEVE